MAVVNPPWTLQNSAAHTAKLFRRALGGLIGSEGIAGFNTSGVTTWPFGLSGDLKVAQRGAGANMSVDIARGGAFIFGDDSTDQGYYFFYNDGTANVVISAADPTNPRIDIIIARIKDTAEGGASGDTSTLEVVTGTPAGSPSAPATPASSLKIAQVAVAAAASSIVNANITDFRTMAATSLFERPTPGCKVYRSSALTVASGFANIGFNAEVWDTDAMHDNVTNNSRLTVPAGMGGKWLASGQIMYGASTTGTFRSILVNVNGTNIASVQQPQINSGATGSVVNIAVPLNLNAGDYVEFQYWHDASVSLAIGNSSESGAWGSLVRIA